MTTVDPSRLNPYDDPGPWGVVDIGGLRLPGVVKSIDGHERPQTWQVQAATAKSGASTTWKGEGIAEAIKILLALANRAAFNAYYDVRDALLPKPGAAPPALLIVNPAINFSGITRISCKNVGPPKWVESGGYWTGEVTVIDYNPAKPANTGSPKPKGSDYSNPEKDPNQALKDEIKDLTDKAAKL